MTRCPFRQLPGLCLLFLCLLFLCFLLCFRFLLSIPSAPKVQMPPQTPKYIQGTKNEPQSPKIARTAPINLLNNSRALTNKTSVPRQLTPESSPESSAKSLSHKFFGAPFLFLIHINDPLPSPITPPFPLTSPPLTPSPHPLPHPLPLPKPLP